MACRTLRPDVVAQETLGPRGHVRAHRNRSAQTSDDGAQRVDIEVPAWTECSNAGASCSCRRDRRWTYGRGPRRSDPLKQRGIRQSAAFPESRPLEFFGGGRQDRRGLRGLTARSVSGLSYGCASAPGGRVPETYEAGTCDLPAQMFRISAPTRSRISACALASGPVVHASKAAYQWKRAAGVKDRGPQPALSRGSGGISDQPVIHPPGRPGRWSTPMNRRYVPKASPR